MHARLRRRLADGAGAEQGEAVCTACMRIAINGAGDTCSAQTPAQRARSRHTVGAGLRRKVGLACAQIRDFSAQFAAVQDQLMRKRDARAGAMRRN